MVDERLERTDGREGPERRGEHRGRPAAARRPHPSLLGDERGEPRSRHRARPAPAPARRRWTLPSAAASPWARRDTGTDTTSSSTCSPRRASSSTRAPVTAVTTTSLTVAPCAWARCPAPRPRSAVATSRRRRSPVAPSRLHRVGEPGAPQARARRARRRAAVPSRPPARSASEPRTAHASRAEAPGRGGSGAGGRARRARPGRRRRSRRRGRRAPRAPPARPCRRRARGARRGRCRPPPRRASSSRRARQSGRVDGEPGVHQVGGGVEQGAPAARHPRRPGTAGRRRARRHAVTRPPGRAPASSQTGRPAPAGCGPAAGRGAGTEAARSSRVERTASAGGRAPGSSTRRAPMAIGTRPPVDGELQHVVGAGPVDRGCPRGGHDPTLGPSWPGHHGVGSRARGAILRACPRVDSGGTRCRPYHGRQPRRGPGPAAFRCRHTCRSGWWSSTPSAVPRTPAPTPRPPPAPRITPRPPAAPAVRPATARSRPRPPTACGGTSRACAPSRCSSCCSSTSGRPTPHGWLRRGRRLLRHLRLPHHLAPAARAPGHAAAARGLLGPARPTAAAGRVPRAARDAAREPGVAPVDAIPTVARETIASAL